MDILKNYINGPELDVSDKFTYMTNKPFVDRLKVRILREMKVFLGLFVCLLVGLTLAKMSEVVVGVFVIFCITGLFAKPIISSVIRKRLAQYSKVTNDQQRNLENIVMNMPEIQPHILQIMKFNDGVYEKDYEVIVAFYNHHLEVNAL